MQYLIFLLLAIALPSVAQQVDPSATRAIDQVLQGARIFELPDGKKLFLGTSNPEDPTKQ